MNEANEILGKLIKWLTTVKKVCPACEGKGKYECTCNPITMMEKCYWCKGTGKTINYKELKNTKIIGKCEVCGGTKVQHCPSCSGTGKIKNQNGDNIKCLKCMGSGIVQCEICKGTGNKNEETITKVKEDVSCTHCNGKGEKKCTNCDSNHKRECYKCHGKGKYVGFFKPLFLLYAWVMIIGLSLQFFYIAIPLIILLIALKIKDKKRNVTSREVRTEVLDEKDSLRNFTDDNALLSPLKVDGRFGYKDLEGNIVIAPQFDEVGNFSEGLAKVKLGSKWGYIDANGGLAIDTKFDEASDFKNGIASIRNDNKCGIMDKNGNIDFN